MAQWISWTALNRSVDATSLWSDIRRSFSASASRREYHIAGHARPSPAATSFPTPESATTPLEDTGQLGSVELSWLTET